ncbi:MAG: GspH/FimT family pseudopilin [Methyloglobulus sp.]|nr:prepilin-type N-terminal cleavage/methylation domain-containing protein [Methyloglobulus sp.]
MKQAQSSSLGFTLIELMVTVSIAAVLLALALPSFAPTIRSNRLTTYTNDLIASFSLARSEAVKRGQHVVVGRNGANWEDGWRVFVDINRMGANANVYDATDAANCTVGADCLLKTYPALSGSYTLRGGNNVAVFVRYVPSGISNYIPDGLSNIANDYFVICDNSDGNNLPEANTAKLITINSVGRLRLAADTSVPPDNIPNLNATTNVATCTPA